MGKISRVPKTPTPTVRAWTGFLLKAKTNAKLGGKGQGQIVEDDVVCLAALLTLIGPPEDEQAQQVNSILQDLLFQPKRARFFPTAVRSIPPDRDTILKLCGVLRTYTRVTGLSVGKGAAKVDEAITVMLALPDPEHYIQHLHKRGFSSLGAMFHPNVFERAKRETAFRGEYGILGGSDEYWKEIKESLNIVDE